MKNILEKTELTTISSFSFQLTSSKDQITLVDIWETVSILGNTGNQRGHWNQTL